MVIRKVELPFYCHYCNKDFGNDHQALLEHNCYNKEQWEKKKNEM